MMILEHYRPHLPSHGSFVQAVIAKRVGAATVLEQCIAGKICGATSVFRRVAQIKTSMAAEKALWATLMFDADGAWKSFVSRWCDAGSGRCRARSLGASGLLFEGEMRQWRRNEKKTKMSFSDFHALIGI